MATNWLYYFNNPDTPTFLTTPTHDRFLEFLDQASNHNSSHSNTTNNDDDHDDTHDMASDSDRFEFIAFLLWYLFLVFCCVVPTCCAYRRRRQAELRLTAQQQANLNQRLQHSNMYILSNMQRHANNSERIQQERKRLLGEELKATTMVRYVEFGMWSYNKQRVCSYPFLYSYIHMFSYLLIADRGTN